MQILRGKGKLYDSNGKYVDDVTYEIHLKSNKPTRPAWWGEIIPQKDIMPVGNHIIELEDGRKGTCITSMNTYSSFGLVTDSYSLEGTSPIKH